MLWFVELLLPPVAAPGDVMGVCALDIGGGGGVLACGLAAADACWMIASFRWSMVSRRTAGCSRRSIDAQTVLSPCTKNANEKDKLWLLETREREY